MQENYIRFDWAMKRLLRDKANYVVLEGFLASLLGKRFKIHRFLESEGNQEDEEDKYNRVDILAESEDGELCIIEVQNSRELSYFHRMLYGVSKAITEYIGLGKPYEEVRKVYSINIVYFELGQGKDYVYHGKTEFVGLHQPHDTLKLSVRQNEKFFGNKEFDVMKRKAASDLFPEYYVLRVNDFDKVATTPLDEVRDQRSTLEFCIKDFLHEEFGVCEKALEKLYHPSMIETYPDAKPNHDGVVLLGSPRTNAVRNPMAMRSLHEIRKVVNTLIKEGKIGPDTEVHVEYARSLNNANMRAAINEHQRTLDKKHKEYAEELKKLYREQANRVNFAL